MKKVLLAKKKIIKQQIKEQLSINFFRLDFIATILTESGEQKKSSSKFKK